MTADAVSGLGFPIPASTRLTVAVETPARRATSLIVMGPRRSVMRICWSGRAIAGAVTCPARGRERQIGSRPSSTPTSSDSSASPALTPDRRTRVIDFSG